MNNGDIEIVSALPSDAEEIAEIYRSLIGMPGCTLDDHYPTIEFVRHDIENGDLFKAVVGGKIAESAYMGYYEERTFSDVFVDLKGSANLGAWVCDASSTERAPRKRC